MVIRVFGIIGLMLASAYFIEGLELAIRILRRPGYDDFRTLIFRFTSMSLDVVFALVLLIPAVGLLFAQRWAKKMWLITMSFLAGLHLVLTLLSQLGHGVSAVHLRWTWLMMLLTAISWWYFTRRDTEAVQPEQATVDQIPEV